MMNKIFKTNQKRIKLNLLKIEITNLFSNIFLSKTQIQKIINDHKNTPKKIETGSKK